MRQSTFKIDDKIGPFTLLSMTDLRDYRGSIIWNCRCNCGHLLNLSTAELKLHRSKSCHSEIKKLPRRNSFVSKRMSKYKGSAKTRNLLFNLTYEEFGDLLLGNCHYCGQIKSNGIDRKDSKIGYVHDNCVSCCAPCNRAKSDMSYEQFKKYLKNLVSFILQQS